MDFQIHDDSDIEVALFQVFFIFVITHNLFITSYDVLQYLHKKDELIS